MVLFLVMWNLLEFLYATFITRSPYQFSLGFDLGTPTLVSLILGWVFIFRSKEG